MTTVHVSWQMRASGLVVALLGIGGFWMAMIFGAEFLDLLALTPADPLRMTGWAGLQSSSAYSRPPSCCMPVGG